LVHVFQEVTLSW